MASKIRTALLSTAVASGLLLSNAPAYASPLVEDSPALETKIETTEEDQSAATAPIAPVIEAPAQPAPAKSSGLAPQPVQQGAPIADTLPQDALADDNNPTESQERPGTADEVASTESAIQNGSSNSTSTYSAPGADVSAGGATTTDEAANVGGVNDSVDTETSSVPVTSSSPATSETPDDQTTESPDETETSQQSDEEVDEENTEEKNANVIIEIVSDFLEDGDPIYLDELMEFLLEVFGGDEQMAVEAFNAIIQALIDDGLLELDGTIPESGPSTSPTPMPSEKPKPQTKPEIKPAGNIKPVVDKKPIVEAAVKPVVQAKQNQLAETGSNGTLLMGGAGVLLVGGGALAMGLRRKARKH